MVQDQHNTVGGQIVPELRGGSLAGPAAPSADAFSAPVGPVAELPGFDDSEPSATEQREALARRTRRADIAGLLPALLLAALGLMGAIVAWRVAVAGNAAGDDDRAALNAGRALASAVIAAEQQVAQTTGAWLDYERAEKRAQALDTAGFHDEALQEKQVATAHWFLVHPEFLSADGVYHPDAHRQALIQEAGTTNDIDPAPHEAAADREYQRINGLLIAALVIVLALPLATFAEVSHGRWRIATGIAGLLVLLIGSALLAAVW